MTNPPGAMPPLPDEFWNLVENLRCQRTGDPVDSAHTKLEEYVNDLIHAQRLATTAEAKASIDRLSDILRRTANAIRGEPPESIAWGWVDLPERSTALIARVAELEEEQSAYRNALIHIGGSSMDISVSRSAIRDAACAALAARKEQQT